MATNNMIIVYNPKFSTVNGRKTVNTTDVKNFIWSHARWFLKAGEMKKFPDEVGQAMLRHMGFLVEVKKVNYDKIKAEVEEKKFKCDKCPFETNTKIAFIQHFKTHEKSEEVTDLSVEEAEHGGEYFGMGKRPQTQDVNAGIPIGGTKSNPVNDREGVGWYGEGLTRDTE